MLNYNIKGTGIDASDELRSYVEKRLGHAEKFLESDPSAHVDVELEHRPLRHGEHYRAEFTVQGAHRVWRAESWGESMHAAIDLAAAELGSELARNKKKRIDVVRRSAARAKEFFRGWRSRA